MNSSPVLPPNEAAWYFFLGFHSRTKVIEVFLAPKSTVREYELGWSEVSENNHSHLV